MAVLLETSLGTLMLDLYCEARPRCSQNFLKLCKIKYYNFCIFHSVQPNLVAQTGDPTSSGRGGESVFMHLYGEQARYFQAELKPRIKHRRKGLVSMVNNGDGCHGSQFFITLADNLDYLNGVHTVFGEITEGLDLLDIFNETYCDQNHRPFKDIRIYHTIIIDDPFPDPANLEIPNKSPDPTLEQYQSGYIGTEEELNQGEDLPPEELEERTQAKEAQSNAKILEMIGDLPDADIRPPDNVLFVCKLNQVTTSEDLEVIFSRFGTILNCDVVKDHKTNVSLQYAFIEFECKEDCENAYFKMDNVLIDDRRIHVDFSQSVAKEWNKYRRGEASKEIKVPAEKKQEKNSYILKNTDHRDSDRYDMVFEQSKKGRDRYRGNSRERTKKKKHKEHSRNRSRSREDYSRDNKRSKIKSDSRERKGHKKRKH